MEEGKQDFWKKMEGTDYLIREKSMYEYEVSTWTRGDRPTSIYTVRDLGKGKWFCNCASRKKPCKHITMVKKWIKKGKSGYTDKGDKEFEKLAKRFLKK